MKSLKKTQKIQKELFYVKNEGGKRVVLSRIYFYFSTWPRSSPEARSGVYYMRCGMRAGGGAELAASATRGRQKPLRSGDKL